MELQQVIKELTNERDRLDALIRSLEKELPGAKTKRGRDRKSVV